MQKLEPIVLFRKSLAEEEEFRIAQEHLHTTEFRSQVPWDFLVFPRYSCLPFYEELEQELKLRNSILINSYRQHQWIADVMAWGGQGGLLEDLTPKTWDNWRNLPSDKSFVMKGRTNSRKQLWRTHMFAEDLNEVPRVAGRLLDDIMIGPQGLVVREYVPLKWLGEGINGQPITNEWRTFWLSLGPNNYRMLAKGFYWGTHPECLEDAQWTPEAAILAGEAAQRIVEAEAARFFVLDIAQTQKGDWIVIEVNDGGMSGLGFVDPQRLYGEIARAFQGRT